MEPILQFLGSYWWLAFPLIGVAGGAARAWERGAKRRHQRRLEIIRAKSDVKAAQIAAKNGYILPATGSIEAQTRQAGDNARDVVNATMGAHAPQLDRLEKAMAAQDAVTSRWLEYELDVAKTIAYPAMSDGRQPLTAAFLRAKKVADSLRPASAKEKLTPEHLADYREAVTDYEVAFDLAEREARRMKDSSFTEPERKRLDTAKQLLSMAVDGAATPAERQLAYKRVREELDGLISLSDGAIDVLEQRVAQALPATPAAAPKASPTDPAAGLTPPPAAS